MEHLLFNSFCLKPGLLLGFQLLMVCLAAAPLPGSTGISFYLNQAGFNRDGPNWPCYRPMKSCHPGLLLR